jgi:hypothetical protein
MPWYRFIFTKRCWEGTTAAEYAMLFMISFAFTTGLLLVALPWLPGGVVANVALSLWGAHFAAVFIAMVFAD